MQINEETFHWRSFEASSLVEQVAYSVGDEVTFPEEIVVNIIEHYNLYFLTPCNLIQKLDAKIVRENYL
jgi:hypothetical protein